MTNIARRIFLAAVMFCTLPQAIAASVNVRDFGAAGDGTTIDTKAFNDAIQAASQNGGGTVLVPPGVYRVYSIHLASHIDLRLEAGAVIKAGEYSNANKYDLPEPGPQPQYQDFGHSHWQNSLIWGIGLEDVSISGRGMIDGTALANGYRTEELQDGWANKAIALKECRNVVIRDITIYHGGHFAVLATGVDNIEFTDLTIDTNRDGLDIDCCRNVRVNGCLVNSPYDDGIVLKASYALDRFQDTRDVAISNCNISGYEVGSVLDATYKPTSNPHGRIYRAPDRIFSAGRIKMGTETSGGFKNVSVTNCTLDYSGGIFIHSMDGGVVEDIVISGITMTNCTDSPIMIRIGSRMRSPEGTPVGSIKRVRISDFNAYASNPAYNTLIAGIPGHPIEDLYMANVHLHSKGGLSPEQALKTVPENEAAYPDPWLFSKNRNHVLPFKGMMLRHIDGAVLKDVYFDFEQKDTRPLLWKDDVKNAKLEVYEK